MVLLQPELSFIPAMAYVDIAAPTYIAEFITPETVLICPNRFIVCGAYAVSARLGPCISAASREMHTVESTIFPPAKYNTTATAPASANTAQQNESSFLKKRRYMYVVATIHTALNSASSTETSIDISAGSEKQSRM